MRYDILTPRKIVFGWGRRTEIGELARWLGRRGLTVGGSKTLKGHPMLDVMKASIRRAELEMVDLWDITREPEVIDIDEVAAAVVRNGVKEGDFLIAIGGGAAIDTAKAIAAMVTNRHGDSVQDFLEGVGRGLTIENAPLPVLAIPTTAGTGSEATKNAVISSYDPPFKKSLRSERMLPDVVLVDPELTVSCPASVTAASGMDAITQLVESFVSIRATPFTRKICRRGLRAVFEGHGGEPAIVRAVEQPTDRRAREAMSHAALLSGIALANSGLGMAHGVAAALGVHARVRHGLACAVMLPIAMKVNQDTVSNDFAELGRLFSGRDIRDEDEAIETSLDITQRINERIGIPRRLSELGVLPEQIPAIVRSSRGNSMNGNPREIDDAELTALLESHL
ncbi:MAG: iron-containing alcohol dehydrogenase [Planctomycetaceae bacterium]|nr:iron-containing alcohol dehydrogenase [Planctomycetaceae bacterium]